jgi:hypothetical protein
VSGTFKHYYAGLVSLGSSLVSGALNNLEVFNLFRRTIKKLFFLYAEQGNALAQSNLGLNEFSKPHTNNLIERDFSTCRPDSYFSGTSLSRV